MLTPPTVGVAKGNIRLDVLCDWIESSILFVDGELSDGDVFDVLIDENLFTEQDAAWQVVRDAWLELRRRQGWLGNASPIYFREQRLGVPGPWQDFPAHSFCLALSLAKWYPGWAGLFGPSYVEQGRLFEEMTKESMKTLFPDWEIYPTGWTRTRTNKLRGVVREVASRLGEAQGDIGRWTTPRANEAGLDLLCYRPFEDRRVGVPVYLMQCGSGGNWDNKLHTPSLRIWTKIVQFAADPKKGFAMPYALLDDEFVEKCNLVDGLLLDRYRLLSAGRANPDWLSPQLKADLVAWLSPRVAALPRY